MQPAIFSSPEQDPGLEFYSWNRTSFAQSDIRLHIPDLDTFRNIVNMSTPLSNFTRTLNYVAGEFLDHIANQLDIYMQDAEEKSDDKYE